MSEKVMAPYGENIPLNCSAVRKKYMKRYTWKKKKHSNIQDYSAANYVSLNIDVKSKKIRLSN